MGNVIESFGLFPEGRKELRTISRVNDAIKALAEAHKFVRRYAHNTIVEAASIQANMAWGSSVKRKRVILPAERRPILVMWATPDHNLSELINLCATVERLVSALKWAKRNGFGDYAIERCHPTTGNLKKDRRIVTGDNDLVLRKGARSARFEVTDLSGRKDTNGKINEDLRSLGMAKNSYPDDDLFLVVGAPSQSQAEDRQHFLDNALRKERKGFVLEKISAPPSVILRVVRR